MCGALGNAWDDTKSSIEGPWKSFVKGDPVGQAISGNQVSFNPDSNLSKIMGEGYSGDPLARHAGIGEDDYARTGKIAGGLAGLFFGSEAALGAGGEGAGDAAVVGGGDAGAYTAGGGTAVGDSGAAAFGGDAAATTVGSNMALGDSGFDSIGSGVGGGAGGGGDVSSGLDYGGGDGGAFSGGGDAGAGSAGGGEASPTTWQDYVSKYGKPLLTSKGAGLALQLYGRHQMSQQLQGQTNQLNNMYAPGSPEYLQLQKELAARDAASGRRSQYGPRSVELAADISKIKSQNLTNPGYLQMLNGQMQNKYGQLSSLNQLYSMYNS